MWNPLGDAVKVVFVPTWENTHILITLQGLLTNHTAARGGRERTVASLIAPAWQGCNRCGFDHWWAISSSANGLTKVQQRIIAHEADIHAAQKFMQGLTLINVGDVSEERLKVGLQPS